MSFTVYRSSAGSGKTFSLVKEYLKIILRNPNNFRHILAITFTNKAANEMKERVMKALSDLARMEDILSGTSSYHLMEQLLSETEMSEAELSDKAREALSLILHHYSEFSIGTIDSFSHRIIRAFAHDFGLPVSFTVELDEDELLTTAVDLLLERAGSDKDLTKLLVRFLDTRMEEERSWNIDWLLISFAKILLDEEGQVEIRKLRNISLEDFSHISRRLYSYIREFENRMGDLGSAGLELIAENDIPQNAFYRGAGGIPKYFTYLAEARFDKLEPSSFVITTIEEDKWHSPTASEEYISAILSIKSQLLDFYQEIILLKEKQQEQYTLYKLLAKTIYPLAVLNEIEQVLSGFKRQNNLVHISEFNTRIARIVMGEPVPFIYERLGERYHHILIDEFQDTSQLQWQNFIPLVENALAGGNFNLVVGDGKQAIYRWRNGDVEQFASLPEIPGSSSNNILRQREQVLTSRFSEQKLTCNFRSSMEIVKFNNRFFCWLSDHLDPSLQGLFNDVEQQPDPGKPGGLIHLEMVPKDDPDLTYEEATINRIEETIKQVIDDGYLLSDMAILCRTRKQAGRISRELILRGINIVSSESLLLNFSPDVNFIAEFIRYLFEPANTIIQASLASYLFHSGLLPEEQDNLHSMLENIAGSVHPGEYLNQVLARNGLEVDRDEMLALPAYDLTEQIIRRFRLNRKADPYIQFFLDAVLNFVDKDQHSASDFPDWWDQQKERLSIVVPEGVNAVRVMTIHKAKGLEFPVVIFPFADESRRVTKDYLWVDLSSDNYLKLKTAFLKAEKIVTQTAFGEQYREELHKSMLDMVTLLYVVMTRPQERLYILTSPPPGNMDEIKSLPAFFAGFLNSSGVYQEDQLIYEFGTVPGRRFRDQPSRDETRRLNTILSGDWRKKIRIRPRAPEMWDMDNPSGKIEFGNRIHTILASVHHASDLDEAIEQAVLSGIIQANEKELIREMGTKVVTHPSLERYFSGTAKVRTEPEILEVNGQTSRPDRVVVDGEEVAVIEYKTGKKHDSYRKQLKRYGDLLHDLGYQRVRKFLVYLSPEIEVEES